MQVLLTIFVLSGVVSFLTNAMLNASPHDSDIENIFGWSTTFALLSGITAALVFIWS